MKLLRRQPVLVRHTVLFSSLLLASAMPAAADEAHVPTIIVTATRTNAALDVLPVTATAVTRENINRRLPLDEAELFRDEPDLAMARDQRRFGATRVNIRGIANNRVVTMIDGVRLSDFYDGGGPTNANMAALPSIFPSFLKQVEIVRGPASSLYGSDALAGVVGFVSLEPADIAREKLSRGVRVQGGYASATGQLTASMVGATRGETLEFLLGYGETQGQEMETKGSLDNVSPNRELANPAKIKDRGVIAKLLLFPSAGHKFSTTLEQRAHHVDSEIRRLSSSLPRVTKILGDDHSQRTRLSLEYEHKPSDIFYDRLLARVYYQDAETRNENYNRRSNTNATCSADRVGANQCDVYQTFRFDQTTIGANLQFESMFAGSAEHVLSYGLDWMQQEVEELRDATRYNRTTGSVSKTLIGENYPLRDFPNGKTKTLGLFLQDEISMQNGQLKFTPGLRYDQTQLKAEVDALAQPLLTAAGRQVSEQTYGKFSPKLGWQWAHSEQLASYGQLSAGFRAPNYNEVNGAFWTNGIPPGYGITPNPGLRPESSVGLELGLRARSADAQGQLAVYDNRYKDFIERTSLNCPADPACLLGVARTDQWQNISRVRIYGAEMRGAFNFAKNWRVDAALAYTHGTDEVRQQALNSVEPFRLSTGLAYELSHWGGEARVRAAARKSRIDETLPINRNQPYFRTPGYAVADLAVWFKPSVNTRINVVLGNVFDKKYWLWSDIRQAEVPNPSGVDFYTQAGRNVRLAFQADF